MFLLTVYCVMQIRSNLLFGVHQVYRASIFGKRGSFFLAHTGQLLNPFHLVIHVIYLDTY